MPSLPIVTQYSNETFDFQRLYEIPEVNDVMVGVVQCALPNLRHRCGPQLLRDLTPCAEESFPVLPYFCTSTVTGDTDSALIPEMPMYTSDWWSEYQLPLPFSGPFIALFNTRMSRLLHDLLKVLAYTTRSMHHQDDWSRFTAYFHTVQQQTQGLDITAFRECLTRYRRILAQERHASATAPATAPTEHASHTEETPLPSTVQCQLTPEGNGEWCRSLDDDSWLMCEFGRVCRKRDFASEVYLCVCKLY